MKKNTVLVTGGSKGIGKAIALEFAKKGFDVVTCGRDQAALKKVSEEITKLGRECYYEILDVRDKKGIHQFIKSVVANFATVIDVLVNNAGVFIPGQIHIEEDGVFEKTMETNLNSTYNFSRATIPHMHASDHAHIFNVCSTASITPYPNGGSYCISKYAQYGLTKVLREELKDKGIGVTAVLPGATLTNSWAGTDLPEERFIKADTVGKLVYQCYDLGPDGIVEDILIRPMEGDFS